MHLKRGLAGLASVGAVLVVGALTPSAALAHPCLSDASANASSLTLHTGGNWAGYMPSFSDLSHECADDLNSYIYQSDAETVADPVPGVPAGPIVSAAGFQIKNLTALGHSPRNVPFSGTGNGVYNSDLAFKDNLVFAGTYEGFRVIDVTNKTAPVQLLNYTGCDVGQGDVIVYENLLIRSWDAPAGASTLCAGQAVGTGFEGIHIFDISNPTAPVMVRQLRMASTGNEAGAPNGCGSHTATAVPDKAARIPLHLQRRLERHVQRHRHRAHQALRPDRREVPQARHARPRRQLLPRQQRAAQRRRHVDQLRHVRGRQRPRHVQVRPDARGRRRGRRREPDAAVVEGR